MNYGKTNQSARILNRMRDYRDVATRGIDEDARRDYRKRFNRLIHNHKDLAQAHGFESLTLADCNLK